MSRDDKYNKLCGVTTPFLSETCHNVSVEPHLQLLTSELLSCRSANAEDGARLDLKVESFWGTDRRLAFFDIMVFVWFAPSYLTFSVTQCYCHVELEKERKYNKRVRDVERGTFPPLVFSSPGGMGPISTIVYKFIVTLIAE